MKPFFSAVAVAFLTACGGGGDSLPDLSDWTQAVAKTTPLNRNEIIYYNVKVKHTFVCGLAVSIYNAQDKNTFYYDGTNVVWGPKAAEQCKD